MVFDLKIWFPKRGFQWSFMILLILFHVLIYIRFFTQYIRFLIKIIKRIPEQNQCSLSAMSLNVWSSHIFFEEIILHVLSLLSLKCIFQNYLVIDDFFSTNNDISKTKKIMLLSYIVWICNFFYNQLSRIYLWFIYWWNKRR